MDDNYRQQTLPSLTFDSPWAKLNLSLDQAFRIFENIDATPDPLLTLDLLRDEQRFSLGEFVDGSYHPS